MSETLDQKLSALKLARIRQVYPSWIEQAAQSELGYAEFLEQLLSEELLARQENQLRRKMKAAGFPYAATIEQFDFSLRPELKRAVLLRFFDSSFVTGACSLVLIGPRAWQDSLGHRVRDQDGATGLQRALSAGPATGECRGQRHLAQRDHATNRAAHPL